MFSRIYSLAALSVIVLMSACGQDSLEEAERNAAVEATKVECALAGAKEFKRQCSTETMAGEKGSMLVVRHPNGGFRRFNILTDGRGLAPADGFDETTIKIIGGGMIEVTSGDDSYRLPADIKSGKGK